MRAFALILGLLILPLSGCLTATVLNNAQHPTESDSAPWANYLLVPITIPADIATSPIQLAAFISYARGERPHGLIVPISKADTTNVPVMPETPVSPKEKDEHD